MDQKEKDVLYQKAWKLLGASHQLDILIEEMSELTHAILKARRDKINITYNFLEELGHVKICLEQVDAILKIPSYSIKDCSYPITNYDNMERMKEIRFIEFRKFVLAIEENMNGETMMEDTE